MTLRNGCFPTLLVLAIWAPVLLWSSNRSGQLRLLGDRGTSAVFVQV